MNTTEALSAYVAEAKRVLGEDRYSTEAKRIFNLPCTVAEVKEKYKAQRDFVKMAMYTSAYSTGNPFVGHIKND